MHPLVRGATAAAVLTALGSLDRRPMEAPPSASPAPAVRGVDGLPAPCAAGTLPEGPVCVRIPGPDERAAAGASVPSPGRHAPEIERIPRRPERPADPAAYVYPAGGAGAAGPRLLAGGDRPGVRVAVRPGERVLLVALDHQVGGAEVVFVGDVFGRTVVTAHRIDVGASPGEAPAAEHRERTILLFHGGLDHTAAGAVVGAKLDVGDELGTAPSELGAGLLELYVEARELRDDAKLEPLTPERLRDPALAVPTDVRNVLPLR
jgi:hypothetical protein